MAYVDGGTVNAVGTAEGAGGVCNAVKTALLAAGWELMASSDGTTYTAGNTPDRVPNLAAWSNASAWCRLREPGGPGGREYVFMRATSTTGIIKYSRATGFIGGSPNATTLPTTGTGGDGVVWIGASIGAVDASTTTAAQAATISGSLVGFRHTCVASNTPLNGVYGFWWIVYQATTGVVGSILYTESVQAGTFPVEDADPSYRQKSGLATFWANVGVTSEALIQYWQAYGLAGAQYVVGGTGIGIPSQVAQDGTTYQRAVPNTVIGYGSYYGSTVQTYPVLIGSTVFWPKGFSTGIGCINVNLNNCDTINLTGAEPRVVIGMNGSIPGWVCPWVPNVAPLY